MAAGLEPFLEKVFACSPETAAGIARRASDRRYPVRATIVKQGDRSDLTHLLAEGRAHALSYGAEGQMALLQEFQPGDFFGAVVHGEPEPETADVVAVEDVRTAAFLVLEFLGLAEAHACVGLAVSRMLLKQLRAATARMERLTLSVPGRVAAELLRLARLSDGRTVRPVPVFAELAIRVHSTRESVSRAVHALERRGLLRREGDTLVLVAPRRLEEEII